MATSDYFFTQVNFTGEKQSFQFYTPGIRAPQSKLATFLPPLSANTKQSASQIFVVSKWGNALQALHNACCANENLRKVRFDFWHEYSVSVLPDFTVFLSNAKIINKRIYSSYDDESPKRGGAKFLDPSLDRTPSFWTGFGFSFNAFEKNGSIPPNIHSLLNFPR